MSITNTIRGHLPIAAIGGAALTAGLMLVLPTSVEAAARTTTVTVTAGKPSEFGFRFDEDASQHGTGHLQGHERRHDPARLQDLCKRKGRTREQLQGHGDEADRSRASDDADLHVQGERHVRVPLHGARSCRSRHEGRPEGDVMAGSFRITVNGLSTA